MNAIKYTRVGGATVTWGASEATDERRWLLQIRDTGPGLQATSAAPLASVLEGDSPPTEDQASADATGAIREHGEGLGLSIVKRLCELLDAAS